MSAVTRPLTRSLPCGFRLAALGEIFVSASSSSCLHDWQIAILDRPDWAAWLDPSISAKAILKRLAAGSLGVERVGFCCPQALRRVAWHQSAVSSRDCLGTRLTRGLT